MEKHSFSYIYILYEIHKSRYMNITFNQIKVFCMVADLESVTKAAEKLFLTQPAVSIQLKNFQDQFPVPLTEIRGRKLVLTAFGKEIRNRCGGILEELKGISELTDAYMGIVAGELNISAVSTGKYIMPYIMADFIRKYPSIKISMDVDNRQKILRKLEENRTDIALVSVLPENFEFESLMLMKNKLYPVVRTDFATDTTDALLRKLPLIFREDGSATRKVMEDYLKKAGIEPKSSIELTSNEAVKQAVIAGLGISIMPLIGLKNDLANGTLSILGSEDFPLVTNWHLISLRTKRKTPAMQAFMEHIAQQKDELINTYFSWQEAF
jgi:DNA-binding transcriptional LysR family regulator